jgi:hypothetical protein
MGCYLLILEADPLWLVGDGWEPGQAYNLK